LKKQLDPNLLHDRILILYNAKDFKLDTIITARNFDCSPISISRSRQNIKWIAEDMLIKMRFQDLFHENKFYSNGSNDNFCTGKEFIDLSNRIQQGRFESKNPSEIAKKERK
jgi:hypothetical protein